MLQLTFVLGTSLLLNCALAVAQDQPQTYEEVKVLAGRGDYQAQRNLAFGYASFPYKGQQKNPLLACAWYLVILNSGSPKLHQGDIGNVTVNCDRLDKKSRAAAEGQARQLFARIYKTSPKL